MLGLLLSASLVVPLEIQWYDREMNYYKQLVAAEMFDPAGASFRHLYYVVKEQSRVELCGEINPKNRMGSYTGFHLFHAQFLGEFPRHAVTVTFGLEGAEARVKSACSVRRP